MAVQVRNGLVGGAHSSVSSQLSLLGVLLRKSSISAFGVENIGGPVIMDFSGTVTSCAKLPLRSIAFWARDGVGRVRHVRNSLDFSYLDPPRPATFFARDFSLATTLLTGSHRLSLPGG